MEEQTDPFIEAMRVLLEQGGFKYYRAYSPEDGDDAVIEALIMGRSPEAIQSAALDVIKTASNAVN
jgi:hypothetical protein